MTNKIKSINPSTISEVNGAIFEALKAIEEKYGVEINQKGNIGYTELNYKLPLSISVLNEDNENAQAEKDFMKYVTMYGLNPEGFKKPFTKNGKKFQFVEVSFRAKKYPFIAERIEDGARYKFTQDGYELVFPTKK